MLIENNETFLSEMTKLFQSFGMQVETLINREKATIESEFKKLKKHSQEIYKLGEKTFIAVYYSGHGILEGGHTIAVSTNHSSNPHVNIEKEVRTLARMANVFVFGFFDCCREVGQDTKGGPKKEAVEGQLLIVFAAPPNAASKSDPRESTSIATGSFLRFMQTQNFLVLPQSVTEWKARSRHTSAVHQVEIVQGCSMRATFNKTTTKTHPSTPTTTTSTTTRAIPAVPVPSPQTEEEATPPKNTGATATSSTMLTLSFRTPSKKHPLVTKFPSTIIIKDLINNVVLKLKLDKSKEWILLHEGGAVDEDMAIGDFAKDKDVFDVELG